MCRLLRMSLLFLLLLFIFCVNVSFASVNYSNFTEFNYLGTREEMFEQLLFECTGLNISDFGSIVRSNDLTNWNNILNEYNSNNYVSIYFNLYHTSNSNLTDPNYLTMMYFNNNNWSNGSGYNCTFYKATNGNGMVTRTSITSQGLKGDLVANYQSKFIFVNNKWYYANNSAYTPIQPTINFIPLSNQIKNIGGLNFYIQNFTRYETFFKIGQLVNFDYRQEYRGICAMLLNGVYQNSDIQLYINPNGEVFVYTSNLLFNQGYGFKFFNGDLETDIYNFYFIPNGTSSGDISSGDYVYNGFDNNDIVPIANIVNSQYDVNSGEIGAYIDTTLFPSGDFSTIASAYDFDSFENQYFNYIYGFFTNIINTLTQTGDVTLPISYRNFNLTLKSSDFYVPNNALKTLVTTILIVYTFFLVYQQLDLMFRHIREFNLFGFLHDTDVDYHMFL